MTKTIQQKLDAGYAECATCHKLIKCDKKGYPLRHGGQAHPCPGVRRLALGVHDTNEKPTTTITLDTRLAELAWDEDAQWIGEDLINTTVAGNDWGLAWNQVVRANGTVRDLRDTLYDR